MNLAALASIISQIVNVIHFAEGFFPASAGKEKLDHVLAKADKIIDGAPLVVAEAQKIKEQVQPLVEGIVATLNETGLFRARRADDVPAAPDETPAPAGAVTAGEPQERGLG